jgi:hypothetical protein
LKKKGKPKYEVIVEWERRKTKKEARNKQEHNKRLHNLLKHQRLKKENERKCSMNNGLLKIVEQLEKNCMQLLKLTHLLILKVTLFLIMVLHLSGAKQTKP